MRSKTKARLLFAVFLFIVLGWALNGWRPELSSVIPYYKETAAELQKGVVEFSRAFSSAHTSPYGVFVQENATKIGGVYALIGLLLLLKPSYRNSGWESLRALCIGLVALVVWFVVGAWLATTCHEINLAHGGVYAFRRDASSQLIAIVTGIAHPLLMIALGLTLWIGVPIYLLLLLMSLPGILYDILRLVVRLPFLIYHWFHYLTVPHPAETAYRAGMASNIPLPELARSVADQMYRYELRDYDALPKSWKSKNWKKRLDAFHDRLKAEDRFMEELIKNLRLKSQFQEFRE